MQNRIYGVNGTKAKESGFDLNQSMLKLLIPLQVINLLTLASQLSGWFIAFSGLCFIWHSCVVFKLITKASRSIKVVVASSGCILLLLSGKEIGLLLGMLHLLCLSYLLKPLELDRRRDFYQLAILGVFVIATSLIFEQSIYFSVLLFFILSLNIAWLTSYFAPLIAISSRIKSAIKLLILSMPLAVVLFIVFPKISPFWQMPVSNSTKTGLSDNVSIGDISNLALSNELAFRVEFDKQPPNYQQMYWRTIVLEQFDGTHWRRAITGHRATLSNMVMRKPSRPEKSEDVIGYQVIAEPSYQHWLFALDVALVDEVKQGKTVYHLNDYTIYSQKKLAQNFSYHVKSATQLTLDLFLPSNRKKRNLKLDEKSNPRLREYAKELKVRYGNDGSKIVNEVLNRYRQDSYRYTLSPPPISNNSLDEFYFSTKAGFCEYYASSFTFLMRAAGVPTRMVLGYLGGEYNAQGGYYSVYQRDAHAWSEVWIQGRGWVRVDPTSAVDPSRVEEGFSQQLLSEQQANSSDFNFNNMNFLLLTRIKMQIEAIDYQWTKFVVNYSQQKQSDFLKSLLGKNVDVKSALIVAFAILLVGVIVWLKRLLERSEVQPNIWEIYFKQALNHLSYLGVEKRNNELFQDYIERVKIESQSLYEIFLPLLHHYEALQYCSQSRRNLELRVKKMRENLKDLKKYTLRN